MAKETFQVLYDIQNAGSGYMGVAAGTTFKKGGTVAKAYEEPVTGLRGPVYKCLLVAIEAESEEEAAQIAVEAYSAGRSTGVAAIPNAAKTLKFFNV